MAVETENETIEVVEEEKVVDGKIRKVRRTIKTTIEEEIVVDADDDTTGDIVRAVPPERRNVLCRCLTPSGIARFGAVKENADGTYSLDVNATESGIHTIYIELDGAQIPGSPFMVRILQAPNRELIRMYGAGLESELIWQYPGLFHIDTRGAGPGELKVNVSGPKGGFAVEMSRGEPDGRIVNVTYKPTVVGVYVVNVLWDGEHIGGSPREVFVSPNPAALCCWAEDPDWCKREYDIRGHLQKIA